MAAAPPVGGGNLEERLSLISRMLEEAVVLLRNTMSEVKEQDDYEGRQHGQPGERPDTHRPR